MGSIKIISFQIGLQSRRTLRNKSQSEIYQINQITVAKILRPKSSLLPKSSVSFLQSVISMHTIDPALILENVSPPKQNRSKTNLNVRIFCHLQINQIELCWIVLNKIIEICKTLWKFCAIREKIICRQMTPKFTTHYNVFFFFDL